MYIFHFIIYLNLKKITNANLEKTEVLLPHKYMYMYCGIGDTLSYYHCAQLRFLREFSIIALYENDINNLTRIKMRNQLQPLMKKIW